ncbi:hypothetical protein GCM10011391_31050 [Pullulanibacillus camelliae]|uniref:YncI copper-binding domain-containing protein n=1 Tax=Pullulanibacillus camelliae TaxID=1707096 RepID=A0A8J3DYK7_9BACL|nr:YcnI family protein [Pullulanibacillus camelliae]GGE50061.1 hypothetical protein GCM10011391_31050 [Pullulanibacillus camelliae]
MKKWLTMIPAVVLSIFIFSSIASAHVKVHPFEVTGDSYQEFTVSVPTEKDIPTTKIRLVVPNSVDVSSFKPKSGWDYTTKKNKDGKITEITWTTKGKGLLPNQFDEFDIMAHVAKNAKEIRWKAYQTYSDGSIVKWIGPEDSENPASITKVVAGDATDTSATDDKSSGQNWGLYLSIISIVLGIIAIIIALVKRKK